MVQRSTPRLRLTQKASLRFHRGRVQYGRAVTEAVVVPVTIQTLSGRGVALCCSKAIHLGLMPRAQVTLRLDVDNDLVELPGKVVWQNDRSDAGVRFFLEVAGTNARRKYLCWLNRELRKRTITIS